MTKSPHVAVVGGGIGGLAVAAALSRKGVKVSLFERAERFEEVGSGIAMFANAMRVLGALGLSEDVKARGNPIHRMSVLAPDGAVLVTDDVRWHEALTGMPSIIIRRPALHAALLAAVPPACISLAHDLVVLEPLIDGVVLHFDDGKEARADCVIGADGLHSTVRKQLWGAQPLRYSGARCWRGIATGIRLPQANTFSVIQGKGPQFGLAPLGPDSAYWFAKYPGDAQGGPGNGAAAKAHLASLFEGWALDAAHVVAATDDDQTIRTDLYDRPPLARWGSGRVTLRGDAAHPMLPALGQGGAMALEDALVLSMHLTSGVPIDQALRRYEHARQPRTRKMAKRSRLMGAISALRGPVSTAFRDAAMKAVPRSVFRRDARWQLAGGPGLGHDGVVLAD